MRTRTELEAAVETHRACYALLKWLGSALDRKFVGPKAAHGYLSDAQAAAEWISEHFENLPADCRPASRVGPQVESFANYFSSYLVSSFDLQQAPGAQLVSYDGCYCRMCSYIGQAPYLKPKRLRPEDRKRAERIKAVCLQELAAQEGLQQDAAKEARILRQHRADLALLAYGQELLSRCRGRACGPAALALWRQLAWRDGAPLRDFELRAAAVLEAEGRLRKALRDAVQRRAAEQGDEADER